MPKRQHPAHAADAQTDAFFAIFDSARMRGELLPDRALQAGVRIQSRPDAACFHYVESACCTLRIAGTPGTRTLHDGDLLFLPRAVPHAIDCVQAAPGGGRLTTAVCQFDSAHGQTLVGVLPGYVHVPKVAAPDALHEDTRQWLGAALQAMRAEDARPSLGSGLMLSRLIDLLFVWSVRHWLATTPAAPRGWLGALRDPVVGKALALLHAQPRHAWSVEALAAALHQSRSGLSQRFTELVGEPPMRYLARWRMQQAADLLAGTSLRVSQVAQQVGYASEAAFSRAFRRMQGTTPLACRRRAQPQGAGVVSRGDTHAP